MCPFDIKTCSIRARCSLFILYGFFGNDVVTICSRPQRTSLFVIDSRYICGSILIDKRNFHKRKVFFTKQSSSHIESSNESTLRMVRYPK